MSGLPLKYILKRGVKKTSENIFRNMISILLCGVCATLFVYSELFFSYDYIAVAAHSFINLNEEDYKYVQAYSAKERDEYENIKYWSLPEEAFADLDGVAPYLKYTSFDMSGAPSGYGGTIEDKSFCVIETATDLLSYGYSFYGDYKESLSEDEIYISDIYLKDGEYCLYEDGVWQRVCYAESADTSDEWFSKFIGKEIYLEKMESAKVKIVGVVNTGYYNLSFSDIGLTGKDEYGHDIKQQREYSLTSDVESAIGCMVYCTEEFLRSYIVKTGSIIFGSEFTSMYKTIREAFSFSITGEGVSYRAERQKIGLKNTVSVSNDYNRQFLHSYADDKGIHHPYAFSSDEWPIMPNVWESGGIYEFTEIVSESDVCSAGEIMISDGIYKLLYDEEDYDFDTKLPSHIGEKISLSFTIDGNTYEIKDKTLVGVTCFAGGYNDDDGTYLEIICPDDEEINRLMSDYITMHYASTVNISGLSEDELYSLATTLNDEYGVWLDIFSIYTAKWEGESIGDAKNIYLIVSTALLVLSLLFGAWNVLHTIKRDYREIGIFRANGVTAKDMSIIYAVQFIIGGIISFILSLIGLNILIANYVPSDKNVIRNMLYFPEIVLYWVGARQVLLLLAISLVVPLIISIFAFFRVRKISPVAAINEAKRNE